VSGPVLAGTVDAFDRTRGVGEIDAGGHRYPFHAANIANGTRTIDVGAHVSFQRLARFGRWEATDIITS
jgi:cold shock CspA family protein